MFAHCNGTTTLAQRGLLSPFLLLFLTARTGKKQPQRTQRGNRLQNSQTIRLFSKCIHFFVEELLLFLSITLCYYYCFFLML